VKAATAPGIKLNGVFEGLNTPAGSSLSLGTTLPARTALSQVPNLASLTGEATGQSAGRGVAVKVLSYANAGDLASNLTQAKPVCATSFSCGFPEPDLSLLPSSVVIGNASGAQVTNSGLAAALTSNYQFASFITPYNGQAYLRNVLVVLGTGARDQGSRALYFSDVVSSQSLTGRIESGGTQNNTGTTTLPSNSSVTPFGAIGGFGAVDPRNVSVIAGSSVIPLDTVSNTVRGGDGGSANSIQAPNPANPLTFRPVEPGAVTPGNQPRVGEVPGAPGPIVETPTEPPPRDPELLLGPVYGLATRADLGRSGALGGIATNVFGQRLLLGASSDPRVCAPADFAAEGAAAASCKPR